MTREGILLKCLLLFPGYGQFKVYIGLVIQLDFGTFFILIIFFLVISTPNLGLELMTLRSRVVVTKPARCPWRNEGLFFFFYEKHGSMSQCLLV